MDKLKPCPFCGGEALLEPYRARKGYEASIQCNQCLCSMSTITYDEEETAIEDVVKAWNRRVNDAPVRHGHWIGEGDGYADGELVFDVWHCSECDYCIDDGTDDPERLPKYCPGCGALMDGGN